MTLTAAQKNLEVIILAAGRGTRMRSSTGLKYCTP